MAALAPVVGVARVVCHGTANGQPVVNVFHIRNGGPPGFNYSNADILSLANSVMTAYKTRFLPRLNVLYSGDDVSATDLTSATGSFAQVAMTGAGGQTGTAIPQSAACCITWKILRHYRGGHPRTYIGPLGTTGIESPISLDATFVGLMITAASGFMADVNALTISGHAQKLVCVHRQQDGAQLAVPLVDDILSATVDSRIDSMRRRLGPDR